MFISPTPIHSQQLQERAISSKPELLDSLNDIADFLSSNANLTLNQSLRTRLWIISTLMLLMSVLYLISLVKNLTSRNCWLIEFNKDGYLNPNIDILVPLLSVVYGALVLSSIILTHRDDGQYLRAPTMLLQQLSYIVLYYCAIVRDKKSLEDFQQIEISKLLWNPNKNHLLVFVYLVWRTLCVIPSVPVQLTAHSTSLLSRGLPPFLFNTLLVLVCISYAVVTLPISIMVTKDAEKLGKEVFDVLPSVKLTAAQYQAQGADSFSPALIIQFETTFASIARDMNQVMRRWRVVCAIYAVYCLCLFTVFIYAFVRLYTTLTLQIKILTEARRRFTRMASVGMRSFDDLTSHTSESIRSSVKYHILLKSAKKVYDSIRHHSQNQSEMMGFWETAESCTENSEMARKSKLGKRYRTAVLGQFLCSASIFTSLIILTLCLTFNAFGVPDRASATEILLLSHEWTGWAYSVPGSVMAFLTCFVALDPGSQSETTPGASTAAREPGPKDNRHHSASSRLSTESDVVKLRSYKPFLVGAEPQLDAEPTDTNGINSWRSKIWRGLRTFAVHSDFPESHRSQKLYSISLGENEKKNDQVIDKVKAQPKPDNEPEISSAPNGNHSLNQHPDGLKSDVNIIKSLRDRHP